MGCRDDRPRPRGLLVAAIFLVGFLLVAGPVGAQFTQYTEPGTLALPDVPTRESLERAVEESRWRLGPVRVDPWVGIRDAGWDNNVFGSSDNPQSDVMVSVGAGVHAYSRFGSDLVLAGHALPEYVWWNELEDRSVLNGRYGLGLFGFFNRVSFQVSATDRREVQYISSELEQPVNVRRDRGAGTVEVRLTGHISAVGTVDATRWRYRDEDFSGPVGDALVQLDRDETRLRAGLRYYFSRDLQVGLGVEDMTVDFPRPERDRSSYGTSPVAEIGWRRTHLGARALVLWADLKPQPGSEFVRFSGALGSFQLHWRPRARLTCYLYGRRNLVYSLTEESPYYTDGRLGLAVGYPFGTGSWLQLFAESGAIAYAQPEGAAPGPDQDVSSYGAHLTMRLYRKLRLRVSLTETEYDLVASAGARNVTRIRLGFAAGDITSEWW